MRTLKEATTDKASKDEYFDNYLYPGTIIKKEEMNRLVKEE